MNDKTVLLRKVGLFAKLKEEELSIVARYSRYYHYSEGDVIFREGTYREELYIIQAGSVSIRSRDQSTEPTEIAQFIEGESFGELDLLDRTPRNASAVAQKDASLLLFPFRGISFKRILGRHPEVFAGILHKLMTMVAGRIRSANSLITQNTPWVEDLRRQLHIDKLTGLFSRTYLEEELGPSLAQSKRKTGFVVVKPDNFKTINDTFGHEVGDSALRLFADTVKSTLRGEGIAVRYRGDELVCLLPRVDGKQAGQIAENLRATISAADFAGLTGDPEFRLTVSLGIAAYPQHGKKPDALVKRAFRLMLAARDEGGDRVNQ